MEGSAKSEDIRDAIEHFRRRVGRPMILIWDGAAIHRAKIIKEYLAKQKDIMVERLPAYAPELNPEEACHGNVKQRLGNFTSQGIDQIRRLVDQGFARLRKRPNLLLHFFQRSGLRVTQLT